jgi:hypothetical protein
MSWQPIETAPKDGTQIDFYIPGWSTRSECEWGPFVWDEKFGWVDFAERHELAEMVGDAVPVQWRPSIWAFGEKH